MNWEHLFSMQKKLDDYIKENHDIEDRNLFEEKYLAFLVELGELANETRCFKFWSKKDRSDKEIILGEFVDGVHFLLSLGLEKDYRYKGNLLEVKNQTETEQFNTVFMQAVQFKQNTTLENYEKLFAAFLKLGTMFGFEENDIQEAYMKKNEINYERQDQGY